LPSRKDHKNDEYEEMSERYGEIEPEKFDYTNIPFY
jgi:hypothetical protein